MSNLSLMNRFLLIGFAMCSLVFFETTWGAEPGEWIVTVEGNGAIAITMSENRNVMMLMCTGSIDGLTLSPSPETLATFGPVSGALEVRWAIDDGAFNIYRPWSAVANEQELMIFGLTAFDRSVRGLVADFEGKSQLRFELRNPRNQATLADHFDLTNAGGQLESLHCLL